MLRPKPKASISDVSTITRDSALWFDLHGFTTTLAELARIFDMNVHTLRARVKAGWPIEAALVAESTDGWKINNVHLLQQQAWVIPAVIAKITYAFDPKKGKR